MYCTYITIYRGNKMPMFYIGSSTMKRIKNGYRGTVRSKKYRLIWENELRENPQLFKTNVISVHDTRQQALEKEKIIHEHLNARYNSLYINEATAGGICGVKTAGNPGKRSDETRAKISQNRKGKYTGYRSPETRASLSKALMGHVHSEETKKKISEKHKGQRKSEETRKKMSEAVKKRVRDPESFRKMWETRRMKALANDITS